MSIYYSLKNDPAKADIAADTNHEPLPTGVFGKPPESALILNAMVLRHTKYPNAAKEFLRFMVEPPQYERWLAGTAGCWGFQ